MPRNSKWWYKWVIDPCCEILHHRFAERTWSTPGVSATWSHHHRRVIFISKKLITCFHILQEDSRNFGISKLIFFAETENQHLVTFFFDACKWNFENFLLKIVLFLVPLYVLINWDEICLILDMDRLCFCWLFFCSPVFQGAALLWAVWSDVGLAVPGGKCWSPSEPRGGSRSIGLPLDAGVTSKTKIFVLLNSRLNYVDFSMLYGHMWLMNVELKWERIFSLLWFGSVVVGLAAVICKEYYWASARERILVFLTKKEE